jgi:hypothetical protein
MKREKGTRCNPIDVVRTTFDGLPIIDSKADLNLIVRNDDVAAAKGNQRSPGNCILAKACKRQAGSHTVAFFRRIAYLDLPDATGARQVNRFELDEAAAAIVEAFDKGKVVKGEVMVTLRSPRKSMRLDTIREKSRKQWERARREKRHAILNGTITDTKVIRAPHKKPRVDVVSVRNGTGLVHNTIVKSPRRSG